MSILTAPAPAPVVTEADEDVAHLVCCDDDVAICGEDVRGECWVGNDEPECAVCRRMALAGASCPVFGCRLRRLLRIGPRRGRS